MNNIEAFLETIGESEGTSTIPTSDRGYNVLVGGTLFDSYADHPRVLVPLPRLGIKSTAAGKYQILERYYDAYKKQLGLRDFSPESQDLIAVQMICECHAFDDVLAGRFAQAIEKCRSRWASFPGAGYGQREHDMSRLTAAYLKNGGVVA